MYRAAVALVLLLATPVIAQDVPIDRATPSGPITDAPRGQAAQPATTADARRGRVATSSVGQAGQRLTRGQAVGGIVPLARIDSRIQNRVQSRIRNRIDQYYDPQANAASPFEVAGEQTRTAGQLRGR